MDVKRAMDRLGKDNPTVRALVVVAADGSVVETSVSPELAKCYAQHVGPLTDLARSFVRDRDPQDSLRFLRVRARRHELLVAPSDGFSLVVVQDVPTEE